MNILFPLAKAGSGSDIFTYNLVSGLNNSSIHADIQYLPNWSDLFPPLMRRFCKPAGFDIIHANSWNGYAFNGLKPILLTAHSAVGLPELKKYQTRSQRLYYQFVSGREKKSITHADAVCCVSNFVAQYLEKIYGFSDGKVIYNGIDLDFFTPKDDSLKDKWENNNDICTLFFAGNQRIMKGYDLLPKIMKELGEGFQLKIATGLRSKNKTINQDHIHELGLINPNNMPNIYRSAEIYLFPSRLEGFGLSVAEAMACGKPVVATNCSSLPELVIDGKGGFLCEMDNIKDFAESVRIIAEDASLRREMGRFNRERAIKNFSLDRMVNEYVKVYKNL